MNDLEEHIHNVLATDFIQKETPVSTLVVAPPERNKSNTVIKFQGKTIIIINDLTAYGLMREIQKHTHNGKCQLGHIIIPDLTRITARGRSVRKELVTTLQILMAEGLQAAHTYNLNVNLKHRLQLGVITCITRRDLQDHRSIWSKIGFLSRFIPFSFNYDDQFKRDILQFINRDVASKDIKIKIRKRRRVNVQIVDNVKPMLIQAARQMAFDIEEFCSTPQQDRIYGARALHQLSSYIKAIAFRSGELLVTEDHYQRFQHLMKYFNYNCSLMLSR